jgi:hypothetical protein
VIPDLPATETPCNPKSENAKTNAEANEMNEFMNFANQWANRPATGSRNVPLVGTLLTYSTCVYSEEQTAWVRTDVSSSVANKGDIGDHTKNTGYGTLYLNTSPPTATLPGKPNTAEDPSTCDESAAMAFPFHILNHSRDATTDHPELQKNADLLDPTTLRIDLDGAVGSCTTPHSGANPKVKGIDECPDSADGLADDWDGDGCPDWDELDKNFSHDDTFSETLGYTGVPPTSGPPTFPGEQNGTDPFNPNDCDTNYSGINHIIATSAPNTATCDNAQIALGTCVGNGSYFACVAKLQHTKTGIQQPLVTTLQCYTNSATVTVNPHPDDLLVCGPADRCGNAKKGRGGSPSYLATPFISIQPGTLRTVLSGAGNYYDTDTNMLHNNGCFDNVKGVLGPGIWTQAVIEAHTGVGYVDIWFFVDCDAPKPTGPPDSHAKIEATEQGADKDTDHDGCTDATELRDGAGDELTGGLRDPWNYWDFYDMDRDGAVGFFDFLGLLRHFGSNDAGAAGTPESPDRKTNPILDVTPETALGVYHPAYDRGNSIPGANGWNENAADGSIGFFDFLSLLRQFGHSCS